jgi:NTE family protein
MVIKKLNLALQGGGAHGAYTWGVLDRLLEEEGIEIEGISGTSAGAMNGATLAAGYQKNGRQGAKDELRKFWKAVSEASYVSPFKQHPLEKWTDRWNLDHSWSYTAFDVLARLVSPYALNPFNFNPLRPILENALDIEATQACRKIKLFVTATRVRDGHARVFSCNEITVDVLLASACLPQVFQAVEIEGDKYWDGGYMGNPAIWPLIYRCDSPEVLLVQLNPIERDDAELYSAADISNRLNEITFNASLIAELRAIRFVSKMVKEGKLEHDRYKDMHIHMVRRPEEMDQLNASSKLNASWAFFQHLHGLGRQAAEVWLQECATRLGDESTINIEHDFLKPLPAKVA